jgi:hypothetical protein
VSSAADDPRAVDLARYPTHMDAALSEGLCPDCPEPVAVRPVELTDAAGETRTVAVLECAACGEDWWPAWTVTPESDGWTILNGQGVRGILAARTWDGHWPHGRAPETP